MNFFLPLLFMLSIFSWSCKGTQYTSPAEFPKKQVAFGSAGGYTGKIDRYTLLENGQIFHYNSIDKVETQINTISKSEAKAVLKKMKEIGFGEMDVVQKGNLNYSIELKDGDTVHKCSWADEGKKAPKELKELYKYLMTFAEVTR